MRRKLFLGIMITAVSIAFIIEIGGCIKWQIDKEAGPFVVWQR